MRIKKPVYSNLWNLQAVIKAHEEIFAIKMCFSLIFNLDL